MPTKDELEAELKALKAELAEKSKALEAVPASGDPLVENPSAQTLHITLGEHRLRLPPGESRMDPNVYLELTEGDDEGAREAFAKLRERKIIRLRMAG